jgi:hypothetical protein
MENVLRFGYCFLFLLLVLFIIAWVIVETGCRNARREKAFNELYDDIAENITNREVNSDNYDVIIAKLQRLGQMKWNKEKCQVLTMNFFWKYRKEATRRASK